MKSILAILAIGLMLATVFSGCVGGENTGDNGGITDGTGDNNSGTGNETANETGGNETENVTLPDNYHAEYSGTIMITDTGAIVYEFPVAEAAKKIKIHVDASTLPGTPVMGGVDVRIYAPDGTEVEYTWAQNDAPLDVEYTAKSIKQFGYGTWTIEFSLPAPFELQGDFTATLDVIYQ